MLNIVGNAVKFTNRGLINIKVDWIDNKREVTDSDFEPEPFSKDEEGLFEKEMMTSRLTSEGYNVLHIYDDNELESYPNDSEYGILKITI